MESSEIDEHVKSELTTSHLWQAELAENCYEHSSDNYGDEGCSHEVAATKISVICSLAVVLHSIL